MDPYTAHNPFPAAYTPREPQFKIVNYSEQRTYESIEYIDDYQKRSILPRKRSNINAP